MKILINCYACSPYGGSEPGMGWNFVNSLSKYNELHIITESTYKKYIDEFFVNNPDRINDFHFYYIKRKLNKSLRKIWPPSYYWTYKTWQKEALQLATRLDQEENFDVIHQLNMAGYREPGYLWKLSKPIIWGPVGGLENMPWQLIPLMRFKGKLFYTAYNFINSWQKHFNYRIKKAFKSAQYVIAATQAEKNEIKRVYNKDSILIPEVGKVDIPFVSINKRKQKEKLRLCWSGLHKPRKALNILLESISKSNTNDIELHIIGSGTETLYWKDIAEKLKLQNLIWHGLVSRSESINIIKRCHLFCITSLRDLTSTVLLEALSCGKPVIALDHCGFSNIITNECGIKIHIENKEQIITDYSNAITYLFENEQKRIELAEGALRRSEELNWNDKAIQISKLYTATKE